MKDGIQMQLTQWNAFFVNQLTIVSLVHEKNKDVSNVNHHMVLMIMEIVCCVQMINIGKMEFVKRIWKGVSVKSQQRNVSVVMTTISFSIRFV